MQRWQSLDPFTALQAEGYWLELAKQRHGTKAMLLSQLAQSNATRKAILDSTEAFDTAMRLILHDRAASAQYEQDMRRQSYEQMSGQDLDNAAAIEIEQQYMISRSLASKLKQELSNELRMG